MNFYLIMSDDNKDMLGYTTDNKVAQRYTSRFIPEISSVNTEGPESAVYVWTVLAEGFKRIQQTVESSADLAWAHMLRELSDYETRNRDDEKMTIEVRCTYQPSAHPLFPGVWALAKVIRLKEVTA